MQVRLADLGCTRYHTDSCSTDTVPGNFSRSGRGQGLLRCRLLWKSLQGKIQRKAEFGISL